MWPITYCVNHSNITLDSNWNYAILTKLSSRNSDFMIRNLVVIKKDNVIVKWDDKPSGLKDDWTLYYKSLTCQDVYNVFLPIYKQLDEMELESLNHPPQYHESSSASEDKDDASDADDESKVEDDDYNEEGDDASAADDSKALDEDDEEPTSKLRTRSDAAASTRSDAPSSDEISNADRLFAHDEYPFAIPSCDHEFTMTDCCNVSRRLHKEYQIGAKSGSIVACNYWCPLGEYRQWGENYLDALTQPSSCHLIVAHTPFVLAILGSIQQPLGSQWVSIPILILLMDLF